VFSKVDCENAFHTLLVAPEDRHKTAFTWNGIVYQFLRAPFGYKQIPGKFQRTFTIIFSGKHGFVAHYIDDILVFSFHLESHAEHTC